MSTKDSDINRDIDTAEGHVRLGVEEAENAGVRNFVRHNDALDDEAEGHVRRDLDDAEDTIKRD